MKKRKANFISIDFSAFQMTNLYVSFRTTDRLKCVLRKNLPPCGKMSEVFWSCDRGLFLGRFDGSRSSDTQRKPKREWTFPWKFSLYHFSIAHHGHRVAAESSPTKLFLHQGFVLARTRLRFLDTRVHTSHTSTTALATSETFTATAGCANQPTFIGFYRATHSPIFFYYDGARV